MEMVHNYKWFGITTDSGPTFTCHGTEIKVDSRFNMIKAITNLKMVFNMKLVITLYMSLIKSVILYAACVLQLGWVLEMQS